FELFLHALAQPGDVREIDLENGGDVRRNAPAVEHVLRDPAAHIAHRLDGHAVAGRERRGRRREGGGGGGCRGGRCWGRGGGGRRYGSGRGSDRRRGGGSALALFDKIENVVFGDAPAQAGARNLIEVDAVFARYVAHQRRRPRSPDRLRSWRRSGDGSPPRPGGWAAGAVVGGGGGGAV